MQNNKSAAVTGQGNAPRVETGEGLKGVSWQDYWTLEAQRDELLNEVSNLRHDYAIVSAQRNETLAALQAIHGELGKVSPAFFAQISEATKDKMQAAIANVEGGAQ